MVFNRPELTKKVFEQIKKYKPTRLYVASDGPRKKNIDDLELNIKVKRFLRILIGNVKFTNLIRSRIWELKKEP